MSLIVILIWLGLGVFGAAASLHSFTREYPDQNHEGAFWMLCLLGPISFTCGLFSWAMENTIGLRFRSLPKEERWKAFQKAYPGLDRDYFERKH